VTEREARVGAYSSLMVAAGGLDKEGDMQWLFQTGLQNASARMIIMKRRRKEEEKKKDL
jgi:hypothetical protein